MAAEQFYFTEPDSELTSSSSRDPLGFEIIWTQMGERVIPHFSTISVGATNFGVCLALVWMVDTYLKERDLSVFSDGEQWRHPRDGLLIVAETLHAYSTIALDPQAKNLFGGQKAARRLNNQGAPLISPFDSEALLVRQLGFGVYGRYRRALSSMDLLDDDGHLENPEIIEDILRRCPELSGLQQSVFAFFDDIRRADDHRLSLSQFTGSQQMAALRRKPTRRHFAPLLIESADLADNSDELIAHIYRELDLPYRGTNHARDIFGRLSESNVLTDQQRERVRDVCRVEEMLLRFEALFDHLWSGRIDTEGCQPLIADIHGRRTDLQTLALRQGLSDITRTRLRKLADIAESNDPDEFLRALVDDYHRDTIADYRNNSAWLSFDSERIVILNNGYSPPNQPLNGPSWSRNYYLRSLASFKDEIQEVT